MSKERKRKKQRAGPEGGGTTGWSRGSLLTTPITPALCSVENLDFRMLVSLLCYGGSLGHILVKLKVGTFLVVSG